ncbi:MAG: hypothetical protein JW956_01130 [Calditrichaceae bacterium]|nr:hypothetical protein [Calditrichaceae bacterium]
MHLKNEHSPTQRAPDGWESPRFQAVCVAGSWFRQNGVVSSHPPAGNAHRYVNEFLIKGYLNKKEEKLVYYMYQLFLLVFLVCIL